MTRLLLIITLLVSYCNTENQQQIPLDQAPPIPTGEGLVEVQAQSNRYFTGEEYLFIQEVKAINNRTLSFRIGWDASWRENEEYDAAWIFIKKREGGAVWKHANILPQSAKSITNRCSDQAAAKLTVAPDGRGLMAQRASNGQGNNDWTISIELAEEVDPTNTEFQVLGLEMVHIAKGPFDLGTLKGETDREEELTPGAGGAPYNPFFTFSQQAKDDYGGIYKVTSEHPITIGKENGNLFWQDAKIRGANTFSGRPEGTLLASFPKGFQGFYQMKYELSQQAYCDFLNTLTPKQQVARDITTTREFKRPIADYRNAIVKKNGGFTTNRPHRPCNFISWLDGQAYADWAGLRHMTELEFEKSCRGPRPAIYREYVWGVNEIKEPGNMRFSATIRQNGRLAQRESGTETTDGNVHASMFSYANFIDVCTPAGNFYDPKCDGCRSFQGGDGGRGPLRNGIFAATAAGDRTAAGGTYYGAMEMGGNLQEPVVTVGHPSGRKFAGTHGDGQLTVDGFSDNPDWQPIDGEYALAGRGGCWKFHENHARTADRFKGLRTNPNRRASHIGFRGVLTAW